MKILAVDTCAGSCSAAVSDGDRLVGEATTLLPQTHSRHLMRLIDMALEMAGTSVEEIDLFAVTRGPGSFTGLRIGIGTVKGMALAAGKPMAGVSSLAALAWPAAAFGGLVCALMDAGKKEVYSACYRFGQGSVDSGAHPDVKKMTGTLRDPLLTERVLRPQDLFAEISEPCIFVGEGARVYAGLIETSLGNLGHVPSGDHHIVRASSVARLAFSRSASAAADPGNEVLPSYIRKSDAELSLGPKGAMRKD